MNRRLFLATAAASAVAVATTVVRTPAQAAPKRAAYPEVKVEVAAAYQPDPAFIAMRKTLSDAIARKDAATLFSLVGPTFLWTVEGAAAEDFDWSRDALHNFKVVFGFRKLGKDADGGVPGGPAWDLLAYFAAENTLYARQANLVCTPTVADPVDSTVFEEARGKIETNDDFADWYFTIAETIVTRSPGDLGPPVAKIGTVALPVLSQYPAAPRGKETVAPTHYEVLLPSGKTGWIFAAAARPLWAERMSFAKTPRGEWKIVSYDQPDEE
jgi:hypothetical protein